MRNIFKSIRSVPFIIFIILFVLRILFLCLDISYWKAGVVSWSASLYCRLITCRCVTYRGILFLHNNNNNIFWLTVPMRGNGFCYVHHYPSLPHPSPHLPMRDLPHPSLHLPHPSLPLRDLPHPHPHPLIPPFPLSPTPLSWTEHFVLRKSSFRDSIAYKCALLEPKRSWCHDESSGRVRRD